MEKNPRPLIMDANTLIDFALSEPRILTLLARYAGTLYIATQVLEKVDQLEASDCVHLGLIVIEPTLEQLIESGEKRGRLAFDDHVCLVLARDHGWDCVTNDKALRTACNEQGVSVFWGLEIMLRLVEDGVLSTEIALKVAQTIHVNNTAYIGEKILGEFENKVRLIAGVEKPQRR